MLRLSSLQKNIDSLIAAAAGFFIIFLFTRHGGIGIEPDGVVYITTAENLHSNGRLVDFTQGPLVDFPALYPFFLSGLMLLTGLKPLVFAPVLNAFLFAVIIYLSGCIMERFLYKSKGYKIAVLSCIVISPCLLEVYSMLWSETLFILLLFLFMIAMRRYFQSYSRKALIATAIIVSLASVTRYAGITIIATGGLLLLLDSKPPMRRKLTDILIYSAISSLLLIINLARNYSVSGTMTGNREKAIKTLSENMHDAGSVFYDGLPFLHQHYTGAAALTGFIIAALAFVCIKNFLRNRRLTTFEDMAAGFSLLYLLFIVVTASISRFEALNSRFLSPIFIPLLYCGSNWIFSLSQNTNATVKKWVMALGILIFLSFQYGQLDADYETWDGVKDAGIPGYTEDQWKYSETVLFIQKDSLPFQKGYTIYSNANDAVYFFTGRIGKFLPHKEYKPGVQEFLNDQHCYIVWFDDGDNPDLVDQDFIINTKKMKLLKKFSDGAIYGFGE
jgi:hypothetical protein